MLSPVLGLASLGYAQILILASPLARVLRSALVQQEQL